ncbi:MAG: MlaD family protein [Pseudomonadota bacterium]
MENRSHALMTGFFTIALIIAAVLAGIWFNRDRVERVPYLIATTQSIPGLNPQATVRYRGVEVGKVDDISFDAKMAGRILIQFGVDPDTPITKTSFATLGYQGVTGIAYIQLDDDATGSPLLHSDKNRVAAVPLRPGFLDQLEKRGKAILDSTEVLTRRVGDLASPANQKVMIAAFDNIGKTAAAYGKVAEGLDPMLDKLPALTAKLDRDLDSFHGFSTSATRLTNDWDKLATDLQGPNGTLTRLSRNVDRFGDSFDAIASDVELQTLPHVVAMTDEARTSLRAVKRTMNTLSDHPQSLIFGAPGTAPGPGEPGFVAPTK